jgi:hypothetical protein
VVNGMMTRLDGDTWREAPDAVPNRVEAFFAAVAGDRREAGLVQVGMPS